MTKSTIGLFLLATTFLSSPAGTAALTPTLDTIKREAADLSGNFVLSELTSALPTGAVEVMIGDKSYYFMPSGENAALLATLAGTPAGSLIASENGIFELNGQKYGFDVASIPDSVFEYAENSVKDYNFIVKEADAEGNLTTKRYKINLKPDNFSASKSITWMEVSKDKKSEAGVIVAELPRKQSKYFQYTYTKPADYTESNTRINDTLSADSVNKVVFKTSDGSAIYNTKDNSSVNITADFIGNSASLSSMISNRGFIGNISGNFMGNFGQAIYNSSNGTAIIGDITGDFIGNYASGKGGAIFNNLGTIGNITGNFIGNYVFNANAIGGAIYNSGIIGDITGDFIGNYSSDSVGGAIFNDYDSSIGNIIGDFIGNHSKAYGGAINNSGRTAIGNITGDFIGNYASYDVGSANGGAIDNIGTIGNITGDFIGNYTLGSYSVQGGAIYNSGTIGDITGDFIGNYDTSRGSAYGGAIYNENATIGDIIGDFIGNYASSSNYSDYVYGGAIYNGSKDTAIIGDITGDFIGNYASVSAVNGIAKGGAIYNSSNGTAIIGDITGNFLSNYVQYLSKYSKLTLGGAVYSNANLSFTAKGKQRFFSGNYTNDQTRGKNYNALFVQSVTDLASAPVIAFDTTGGGAWVVNDSIEGGYASSTDVTYAGRYYNLSFTGDGVLNEDGLTDQYISINNDVINAGEVTVEGTTLRFGAYQHEDKTANNWDGHGRFLAALKADGTADLDAEAVTTLSLNNAAFDLYNEYQDTVNLKGWKASGDSFLHVDVDVENLTADMLNVNGNVEGTTKLVLYPTSDKDIRGESILFAQSTNDTTGNADSFKVWRVYRSPYMFETKYTKTGENANKWELEMNDTANDYAGVEPGERPDPEVPDLPDIPDPDLPDIPDLRPHPMPAPGGKAEVAPEVIGYQSVTAAAVAQNANLIYNVMNKVTDNRLYCPGCGFYDYYWNGEAFHNLWVNPVYTSLSIKSPTEIDADVWGIEAGGDLQHDLNNKLGLFVSYRKGSYDMNGDGKHYYSTVGSEIDIDSYLAGLYYRYDRNNWYAFATLYGGTQQADIKTDDGIKSDTDGVEFGASLEAGYDYNLTDTVYLTPSLGVFYTQVNYDDATDNVGKKAEYNDLKQIELEAGVKLTKAFRLDEGYANVYVKPSVVQTLVDGDEVNITGLGKTNTLDDETLGRIELGGRYGFTDQLSAYGWANYTFGSDYDATTVGLGLNYAF